MKNQKILNNISNRDKVFGKLCQEAENSYENANYFAALACLFVAAEQIIKYSLDENDGNFQQALLKAKEKEIIDENLFIALNNLRNFRNRLFHENHYIPTTEFVFDGIVYPPDEDETKKVIYDKFSQSIFNLVEKITLNNND
ncbi:MAG: hypothetical protein Q8P80_02775 [Candidatus Levybacteria bacterium]|nr:hypothetical protein [Candidatus Levybacteria bacterium]